jgi:hypothetical protein
LQGVNLVSHTACRGALLDLECSYGIAEAQISREQIEVEFGHISGDHNFLVIPAEKGAAAASGQAAAGRRAHIHSYSGKIRLESGVAIPAKDIVAVCLTAAQSNN